MLRLFWEQKPLDPEGGVRTVTGISWKLMGLIAVRVTTGFGFSFSPGDKTVSRGKGQQGAQVREKRNLYMGNFEFWDQRTWTTSQVPYILDVHD
jgi:hypothetical protein